MSPADVPQAPAIVTPELSFGLDKAIAAVPTGKRGLATATFSKTGVEAAVGVNVWKGLSLGGYASKAWGGKGYTAGARAAFVW